jgi:hypothetical protein
MVSWDNANKKITFTKNFFTSNLSTTYGGGYFIDYNGVQNAFYQPDFYYVDCPIPNTGVLAFRPYKQTVAGYRGQYSVDGNIHWFVNQTGQDLDVGFSNQISCDVAFASATRKIESNWTQTRFFDAKGTGYQGGGTHAPTSPLENNTTFPFALPLRPGFHALVDSRYFTDPSYPANGAFRIKFIRRDDSNFLTTSPASQAQYGLSINVPVKIDCHYSRNRPYLLNGDIMWAGSRRGTVNTFSYNIIKQPPLAS